MGNLKTMISVSIIVPCFNGAETLAETLDALVGQVWNKRWEIVLSNNGSTDCSLEIFLAYAVRHPAIPMRIVDASRGKGRSYAVNVGVAAAHGRSIVFCDADDVPAPGWLAAMGEALENAGLVAARVDSRKLNPGWVGEYKEWPGGGVYRLTSPPYCLSAGGGIMGVRKALFERLGGFDEAFVTAEDNDFCIRAFLAGVPVHEVPDAKMSVRFRNDLAGVYRQCRSWSYYNVRLYKSYKHLGPPLRRNWPRFFRTWLTLLRWWLAKNVLRKPQTTADRARFRKQLGWEMGRLTGMIAFRTGPNSGLPPEPMKPALELAPKT